jgi:hypothetical protein
MGKYGIGLTVYAVLGLTALQLWADETKNAAGGKQEEALQQEWLQAAAKVLSLSAKQQQEMRTVQDECRQQTEPQKKQLETLAHEEHQALRNVLTPEQRNKLPDVLKAKWHKECDAMGTKLGLTEEEKKRIKGIKEEYEPKFRELMTQKDDSQQQQRLHELKMAFFTAFFRALNDDQKVAAPFVIEEHLQMQHAKAAREQTHKDIAEALGISADQKSQIEKIKSQYQPKIEKAAETLQQHFKDSRARLEKVLTAEQRKKFDELCKGKERG